MRTMLPWQKTAWDPNLGERQRQLVLLGFFSPEHFTPMRGCHRSSIDERERQHVLSLAFWRRRRHRMVDWMREHILRAERISAIDQMETEEGKDKSLSSSIIQQLEDVLEKVQLERLHG